MKKVIKTNKLRVLLNSVVLTTTITTTLPFNVLSVKAANQLENLNKHSIVTNTQTHQDNLTIVSNSKTSKHKLLTSKIETVTKISKNLITIGKKSYKFSKSLSGLFENTAALKKARVQFTYDEQNNIKEVLLIELNTPGKASKKGDLQYKGNILFDAKNTKFTGKLRINADYVSVKNITIAKDLELTSKAKSVFYTSKMTVKGKTIVTGQSQSLKTVNTSQSSSNGKSSKFYQKLSFVSKGIKTSKSTLQTQATNFVIVLNGSNLARVEISKPNTTLNATGNTVVGDLAVSSDAHISTDTKTTLNKLTILSGTRYLNLQGNIGTINILANSLTFNGKANIDLINISSVGASIQSNLNGKINSIISSGNLNLSGIVGTNVGTIEMTGTASTLQFEIPAKLIIIRTTGTSLQVIGNTTIGDIELNTISNVLIDILNVGNIYASADNKGKIDLGKNTIVTNISNRNLLNNQGQLRQIKLESGVLIQFEVPLTIDQILSNRVINKILGIPAIDNLTLANEAIVIDANDSYQQLTISQKALISVLYQDKLSKSVALITNMKAAAFVSGLIEALPMEISYQNQAQIEAARLGFVNLTDDQKFFIKNEAKLVLAEGALVIALNDKAAAVVVDQLIESLPSNVTYTHEAQIASVRAAYDALNSVQKQQVEKISDLVTAEGKLVIALDNKAKADVVKVLIQSLPSIVKYTDQTQIVTARNAYISLTAAQQLLVDNLVKLDIAESNLMNALDDKAKADVVKLQIQSLPSSVSYTDQIRIVETRNAYIALTAAQQLLVDNESDLVVAENKLIVALENKAKAVVVDQLIESLPSDVMYTHEAQVASARAAYEALNSDQKQLVAKLSDLEATEAKLVIALDNKAKADLVRVQIQSLPSIVMYSDQTQIVAARNAYIALTAAQQLLVDNLVELEVAEGKLVIAINDKQEADKIILLINALPNVVKYSDEAQISAARDGYNSLTINQKDLVNEDPLIEAEQKLAVILADLSAAEVVMDLINALPANVSIADQAQINEAKNKYDLLTNAQKVFVSNKVILDEAIQKLTDQLAAKTVTDLITALPLNVTRNDNVQIEAARTAFNNLSVTQRSFVNEAPLLDAEQKLQTALTTLSEVQSKEITNLDYSSVYATQARQESKVINDTNFKSHPISFVINEGSVSIPVNLNWDIPLNGFTTGQVVGSAVDSIIQDYCNANHINLGNRTIGANGFGNTFFISTFKTGTSASITLSGNDWSSLFQNSQFSGTNDDFTKNKSFTINDGVNQVSILLNSKYTNMNTLVNRINQQLSKASISAIAEKLSETQFRIVAKTLSDTITVSGMDKNQFFN